MHGFLVALADKYRDHARGILHGFVDPRLLVRGGAIEHVADDIFPMSRVPDADAQAIEVAPQVRNDVLQAVMPPGASTEFEPNRPGLQIEFVMGDKDSGGRDLQETGKTGHRQPALVHVRIRIE